MITLYTETLQQYIDNGGNIHDELFEQIPEIIVPTSDNKVTSLSFKQMFLDRYSLREIGAETEQLFEVYLKIQLNTFLITFNQKFITYQQSVGKLMDRSVELQRHKTDKNFLNPITSNGAKLQDYVETDEKHTQSYGWFKSNPELLQQSMELESIYSRALDSFENLFMGVY